MSSLSFYHLDEKTRNGRDMILQQIGYSCQIADLGSPRQQLYRRICVRPKIFPKHVFICLMFSIIRCVRVYGSMLRSMLRSVSQTSVCLFFFFFRILDFFVVGGVYNYYYYLFWLCWVFTIHGTQFQQCGTWTYLRCMDLFVVCRILVP